MSKKKSAADTEAMMYLEKFPQTATTTLAKIAFRDHPRLWPTFNACYLMFRRLRGNQGERNRPIAKKPRPNGVPGDPFGKIPKGLEEMKNWRPYVINGPCKALVLCDIHIPYHDKDALEIALRAGAEYGCDKVILLGDVMDNYSVSHWSTDPRQRDYPGEIETGRKVLGVIRECFPDAEIVLKLGNHDERLESYLMCKAPEVLGLQEFKLEKLLACADSGIQVVTDMRPLRMGKLFALHGHEYRFAISNPVNPARGLFLRAKVHALCGHFHQSSQHSGKGLDDDVVSCWSIGALCNLRPRYRPLNEWNHGFAIVSVEKNGAFQVENKRIVNGGAWN